MFLDSVLSYANIDQTFDDSLYFVCHSSQYNDCSCGLG